MDVDGNDNTPEWGYCDKEGCKEPAIPCYLPYNMPPDDPDDCLCVDHCTDAGYCWGCGYFCAGLESFDFNPRGLCSECRDDPDLTGEDYDENTDFGWIDPYEMDLGAS